MSVASRLRGYAYLLGVAGLYALAAVWIAVSVPAPAPLAPLSLWREVDFTTAPPSAGKTTPPLLEDDFAHPLTPPVLLEAALVWRPLGADFLLYSALDGTRHLRHDWLRGSPQQWAAFPSAEGLILLWTTPDEALWSALLSAEGDQVGAPILLGRGVDHFSARRFLTGGLSVLYREEGGLRWRLLDEKARPLPPLALNIRNAPHAFDVVNDPQDPTQVWIIWGEAEGLQALRLRLSNPPVLGQTRRVASVRLGAGEWLGRLWALEVGGRVWVLWGVSAADRPDVERYAAVWLGEEGEPAPLVLPQAEALRWAPRHPDLPRVSMAALVGGAWRPYSLEFDATGALGFRALDGPDVTASPIALYGEHAAWVTLDLSGAPRLVVRTLDPRFGVFRYPPETPKNLRQAWLNGLRRSPLGGVWLMVAMGVLLITGGRPWSLAAALVAYLGAKMLLPFGLFENYPELLGGAGRIFIWLACMGSAGLGAVLAFIGLGRSDLPLGLPCATFCLTDALLTFAFWGTSLQ